MDKSTVSRALNGTGRVSDETRERVVAAARDLGYRPSRLAQGFRSGSTSTVGLVVPSLAAPGAAEFASGALEVLEDAGLSVILAEAPEGAELRALDFPIDGALLAPGASAEHRRWLRERGLAVSDARACVTAEAGASSEYAAALDAYRLLVRYGHQRIGLVELVAEIEAERHRVRFDAVDDALNDSPLKAIGEARAHLIPVETPEAAYAAVRRVLEEGLITAVSLGSDVLVGPACAAIQDREAVVGRDLSLLAVMHSRASEEAQPRLSRLAHDTRADGRRAARNLLESLRPELGLEARAEVDASERHWSFVQQSSIASSPIVPNC